MATTLIGVAETMQPGFGQRLWDVARYELQVAGGVLLKLGVALLMVEALHWVLAAAPMPQPPAAPTVIGESAQSVQVAAPAAGADYTAAPSQAPSATR